MDKIVLTLAELQAAGGPGQVTARKHAKKGLLTIIRLPNGAAGVTVEEARRYLSAGPSIYGEGTRRDQSAAIAARARTRPETKARLLGTAA